MLQSNFLWAYATLGERMSDACLEALAAQAQEQLLHFKPKNLATMMWAFAKLEFTPGAALMRSCEAHAVREAGTFIPQELVRCCLLAHKRQKCKCEVQVFAFQLAVFHG